MTEQIPARPLRWAGRQPGEGRLSPAPVEATDPAPERLPDPGPAPMARVEQLYERVYPELPGVQIRRARDWTMFNHQCSPPMVLAPAPPAGLLAYGPATVQPDQPIVDEHGRTLVLVPDGSHGDLWRCPCDTLWSFVTKGRRRHWWTRHRWDGTGWIPASRGTRARYWRAR